VVKEYPVDLTGRGPTVNFRCAFLGSSASGTARVLVYMGGTTLYPDGDFIGQVLVTKPEDTPGNIVATFPNPGVTRIKVVLQSYSDGVDASISHFSGVIG
jgi:hypothetical protein